MRSKLIGILLGCGLVAASVAPAFACDYVTTTANETPQHTAQAQTPADSKTQ